MVTQAGLRGQGGYGAPWTGTIIVRGVVLATYFADQENRRGIAGADFEPKAVACDVITYGGRRRHFLPRVAVAQPRHALNDHTALWIPRESTIDLSTGQDVQQIIPQATFNPNAGGDYIPELSRRQPYDPRNFDGDHVLVSFLDDDVQQPIILPYQLPHPRTNFRYELADGRRRRSRFRGVIEEIDKQGNWTLDTTRANGGGVDLDGLETPAADASHGNVRVYASNQAEVDVRGVDSDQANELYRLRLKQEEALVALRTAIGLLVQNTTGVDSDTTLQVGDGAVAVAIADTLEVLWGNLAAYLDAHVHPESALRVALTAAGTALNAAGIDPTLVGLAQLAAGSLVTAGASLTTAGSSLPDAPSSSAPAWDPQINSGKVTIPDN